MIFRSLAKAVRGRTVVGGAGVRLTRLLGHGTVRDFDPFLVLDSIDSYNPEDYTRGFPPHPHRGIESVTYLLEGRVDFQDSLGHKSCIRSGGCQWITAGSGVIHSEMPQAAGRLSGLQLWINLPAKNKMAAPKYRGLDASEIPLVREDGVDVRILSGSFKGELGAVQSEYVDTDYLDIGMQPGRSLFLPTAPRQTVFIYIIKGEAALREDGVFLPTRAALLLTEGEAVAFYSGARGARFLFFSGAPLGEPVEWSGTIVMNTEDELRQAFQELDEGVFIKNDPPGET